MTGKLVVDAGPVIALANAGCLRVLRTAAQTVVMPHGVYDEIVVMSPPDLAVESVIHASRNWLGIVSSPPLSPELLSAGLGTGESEVLACALGDDDSTALLDERDARALGQRLGVRLTGSLALLRKAKEAGLIEGAGPIIQAMTAGGYRFSNALVTRFLRDIGE